MPKEIIKEIREENKILKPLSFSTIFFKIWEYFIRFIGICVMLAGLGIGLAIVMEAWKLYEYPRKVKDFAQKIEEDSHIDEKTTSFMKNFQKSKEGENTPTESPWKVSYFIAWILILSLLLLIAMISFYAMREGGQLALAGVSNQKMLQSLAEENQKFARDLASEMAQQFAQMSTQKKIADEYINAILKNMKSEK